MNTRRTQLNVTLKQFYDKPVAKVSLELFFSIAAVIFFALFAIRPTLVTMSDLLKEIQDKENLNQQLNQKIAALSTVQTEYQSIEPDLPVLDDAIPPTPRFEEALLTIEKIASDNNLIIIGIESKEVPKEVGEEVPFAQKVRQSKAITISVVGDYPSIRQFVEGLRSIRRQMIINGVTFSSSDQRGNKKLQATITISIQYFGVAN